MSKQRHSMVATINILNNYLSLPLSSSLPPSLPPSLVPQCYALHILGSVKITPGPLALDQFLEATSKYQGKTASALGPSTQL